MSLTSLVHTRETITAGVIDNQRPNGKESAAWSQPTTVSGLDQNPSLNTVPDSEKTDTPLPWT
ncbi:hypothetical protein [Corynebacterium sp. zg254]